MTERPPTAPASPPGGREAGRFSTENLRAAWWAYRSLRRARALLAAHGGFTCEIPPPPDVSWAARRGVMAAMRRSPNTCLERAVVLQRWLHAQGFDHSIVVGVAKRDGEVKAHAWLDFEWRQGLIYDEIHRVPALL